MPHLFNIISDKTWVNVISIWNDYFCCSCWIRLYWVDRDHWVPGWIKIESLHPIDKLWANDGFVLALCVYQLVRAERDMCLNGLKLQELLIKDVWLYLFGHFHHAWYITLYALEIQYIHLKIKAWFPADDFVCKREVGVWNSLLRAILMSRQSYVLAMMDWDGSCFLLKMWIG